MSTTPNPTPTPVIPASPDAPEPRFAWHRDDPEARLGLGGTRFTDVRSGAWLIAAGLLTVGFYAVLTALPTSRLVNIFTQRGAVQYVTVLFFFWALLILFIKLMKVARQHAAVRYDQLVPADPDFVLSPGTVNEVLAHLHRVCIDPAKFFLFNRIEFALSNLKNMGRISDVDDVLRSKAESDVDVMESSYTLVRGLIWAIPVLGFIGTVQGLSSSLGSFGQVLVDTEDFAGIKPALKEVTAGLSTAFDTTFVALVAALLVQLLLTLVRKREEDLLDACNEYCQRHIVGRLRLTPLDADGDR
ncbi:MAG: MotA/TolQ/ExbB proton channel family protein [Planctomycetota bacterium]